MDVFTEDARAVARENTAFRRVLYTGAASQIVAMAIPPGEEIGEERHPADQIFFVYEGEAEVYVEYRIDIVCTNGVIAVPANARHNVRSIGEVPLKLLTIYAPPMHADGEVEQTNPERLLIGTT